MDVLAKLNVVVDNRVAEYCSLKERTVIGRSRHADVLLVDPAASREHAVIVRDGPRFVIEDLKSANGIEVNGAPTERAILAEGDIIRLGNSVLIFTFEDTPPEADRLVFVEAGGVLPDGDWRDVRDVMFRLAATQAAVDAVGHALTELCEKSCLNEAEVRYLTTAGLEALHNGYRHGAKKDASKRIDARLLRDVKRVVWRIADDGPGFDYRQALKIAREGDALGVARARYKAGRPGGLGIMLMVRCVDLVEWNESGSEVTLTKCPGEVFQRETIYAGLDFVPERPPDLPPR